MPQEVRYASRQTEGVNWHDITPRMGAAYDVFGNGRTAVKFSLGKYILAFTANNSDLDLNPLIRTTVSTTREWTDRDGDHYWDCNLANVGTNGECGPAASANFGKEVFTRSYDPDFISGWGNRQYNWQMGVVHPAGGRAARGGERRLQPPVVRQPLHRGQPGRRPGGVHAVLHHWRRSIRGCREAAAIRSAPSTTSS